MDKITKETIFNSFSFSGEPNRKYGKAEAHTLTKSPSSPNLSEEADSSKENEPEVWVSSIALDSSLMLNNPKG